MWVRGAGASRAPRAQAQAEKTKVNAAAQGGVGRLEQPGGTCRVGAAARREVEGCRAVSCLHAPPLPRQQPAASRQHRAPDCLDKRSHARSSPLSPPPWPPAAALTCQLAPGSGRACMAMPIPSRLSRSLLQPRARGARSRGLSRRLLYAFLLSGSAPARQARCRALYRGNPPAVQYRGNRRREARRTMVEATRQVLRAHAKGGRRLLSGSHRCKANRRTNATRWRSVSRLPKRRTARSPPTSEGICAGSDKRTCAQHRDTSTQRGSSRHMLCTPRPL